MKSILFFTLTLFLLGLTACSVNEGIGGSSKITGTLVLKSYNSDLSVAVDSAAAAAEEVYIRFGNSQAVGSRERTSNTGYFEFPYLFEGNYTVYYFTDARVDGRISKVEHTIEVKLDKGEHKKLGILIQKKALDFNDGSAAISGILVSKKYNTGFSQLLDSIPAQGEEVYLAYGEPKAEVERVRTSNTGYFSFTGLIPGEYTVYYYSDNALGEKEEVSTIVRIDKTENYEMGTLCLNEVLDFDEGYARIRGRVRELLYYSYPHVKDTIPAQEKEVYLRYNNGVSYVERIRTDYNGYFEFANLIPGEYEVYVYGENYINTPEKVVRKKQAVITHLSDTTLNLGDFLIDNF